MALRRIILASCLACVISSLAACSGQITPEEAKAEIADPENGLMKEYSERGFSVKVLLKPSTLVLAEELSKKSINTEERQKMNFNDSYFFIISISKDGKELLSNAGDMRSFQELVNNLAFKAGEYAQFVTDSGDTLYPSGFHYPRMYGSTANTSIIMTFQRKPGEQYDFFDLIIRDLGVGLLPAKTRFYQRDISKISDRIKITE